MEEGDDFTVDRVQDEIFCLLQDAGVEDLSIILDEDLDCYESVSEEIVINLFVEEIQKRKMRMVKMKRKKTALQKLMLLIKKAEECLLALKKFYEQNNLELQLGFVHEELYSIKKQIATSLKQSKVSDFFK